MDMNLDVFDLRGLRREGEEIPWFLQLAQDVYGGYVGEKLSKDSPKVFWEGLKRMGVTQIIDLRYNYKPEVFKLRCEKFGIKYFSYPIHNDPETIANMVENFYEFSDLIMEGHFYMMGRTSSYIALCVYWMYGNNAGLYPMDFRNKITRDTHVMKKVLPILSEIAKYKEEHLDDMSNKMEYADELQERIRDFKECPFPRKVWFEIFNFLRAFRNGSVVYDVSVDGLGVVGYMYPSSHEYEGWEFDITLRPFVSGKAKSFADAQLLIARHLCKNIPHSIKFPALPQSMKMAIGILQKALEE